MKRGTEPTYRPCPDLRLARNPTSLCGPTHLGDRLARLRSFIQKSRGQAHTVLYWARCVQRSRHPKSPKGGFIWQKNSGGDRPSGRWGRPPYSPPRQMLSSATDSASHRLAQAHLVPSSRQIVLFYRHAFFHFHTPKGRNQRQQRHRSDSGHCGF